MSITGKNNYFQLIPEKVIQNISGIEDKIQPRIKGYSRDYLFEVVSIVARLTRKDGKPTQLQIAYIKKLVPQGDRYLNELRNHMIIQRTGNAIKGRTSYQYSFTLGYLSKFKSIPLKNQRLIRRIKIAKEKKNKAVKISLQGCRKQVNYIKQLSIDEEYKVYVEDNYKHEIEKFNAVFASATRIVNKDFFYSVDSTSGRFHSNLTNCAKGLRPFLRINGIPLVNIDIKNSQPFLSIILLTNPTKVAWMTNNPAFALLLQTLKVPQNKDVSKYISLVNDGQLYEYLMTEFSIHGLFLTRSETKVQVLRILFARNRMPKDETNRKARQIFTENFPTVHRIFSKIRGHEKGDKFSNFKRFAILLQRIESHLMLKVILKRIYQEMPGIVAVTIHDSIMTVNDKEIAEAVRKIMSDELRSFVGFRPQISIEGSIEEKGEKVNI